MASVKRIPAVALVLLLAACATLAPSASAPSTSPPSAVSASSMAPATVSSAAVPASLAKSVLLSVPFAPQAPFANWDEVHEETCEEAALIMVDRYLDKQPITLEEMEGEILAMVAWEEKNGYPRDVTAAQVADIATKYFERSAHIIRGDDVTIDMLKKELAAGNPVIIPAQGQFLGNPYFSGEGPPYHMLVLIGYRGDVFITNDPGTKRGQKYEYPADVILNAIHDWTGDKATVKDGPKAVVIVER